MTQHEIDLWSIRLYDLTQPHQTINLDCPSRNALSIDSPSPLLVPFSPFHAILIHHHHLLLTSFLINLSFFLLHHAQPP